VRYEVALVTNLAFHGGPEFAPAIRDLPKPETVTIEFEGRRFVWHAVPPLETDLGGRTGLLHRVRRHLAEGLGRAARKLETVHRQDRGPTVTTPIDDMDDYEAERLATARFLSAVVYETREAVEVQAGGGAGVPAEFDPPVATALRRFGDRIVHAPAEVVVVRDDQLRLVLGYYREGVGTDSPYFKFLRSGMRSRSRLRTSAAGERRGFDRRWRATPDSVTTSTRRPPTGGTASKMSAVTPSRTRSATPLAFLASPTSIPMTRRFAAASTTTRDCSTILSVFAFASDGVTAPSTSGVVRRKPRR
jgi:hypothetical protein